MAKDQNYRLLLIPESLNLSQQDINNIALLKDSIAPRQMERLLTDMALEWSKHDYLTADELDQLHVLINLLREA